MPSSQTITAQYSFSPYTKARAIQVNANFNNLRGHLLPIDPNTATASDQEYDLGTSVYRWRTGYVSGVSLSISIGSSQILSGTTAGGFKFVKDATTTFQVLGDRFTGQNCTPMGPTSAAGLGQMAVSSALNLFVTNTSQNIAGSTCTLQTNGRPVFIGMMGVPGTSGVSGIELSFVSLSAAEMVFRVGFLDAGTTIGSNEIGSGVTGGSGISVNPAQNTTFAPNCFGRIYFAPTGTHTYYAQVNSTTTTLNFTTFEFKNMRLIAFELQ